MVTGNDDYRVNSYKIVFWGVSLMAESKVVPARWTKRVHVDVTQALAVLWSHCLSTVLEEGDEAFQGKCYVFRDPRADSGQRIVKPHDHSLLVPFQRPSSKPTASNTGP